MPLTPLQLDSLDQLLVSLAPADNPLPPVRAGFPGLPVSRCDASDMRGETPYRRSGAFDLFLVDTASHCWRIVDDPREAGGVVIAAQA